MELTLDRKIHRLFWHYVNERHKIWHRRFVLHKDAPWTNDAIMQTVHFTNVYPELDRGHQYLINHVVPDYPIRDKIFRTMVYRAFNNIDSWKLINNYVSFKTFDSEKIYERLQQRKMLGHKVFTGAYMVTGTRFADSNEKLVNYCKGLLPSIIAELDKNVNRIIDADTLEQTFDIFKKMTGVGKFNAYILATDMSYTGIKPYSLNDWVNVGPGAMKAINLIYKNPTKPYEKYIHALRDVQKDYLFDFPYYNNQYLTLDCIEWSLCEFQKYYAKLSNEYRAKARYFKPRDELGDNPYE